MRNGRLESDGMERFTETGYENIPTDFADKNIWKCINKLRELEDAEEQGLLLRLPCKVGDTVYALFISGVNTEAHKPIYELFEAKVIRFTQDSFALCVEIMTKSGQKSEVTVSAFGETIFFTREEAESALAEKGGAE